MKKDTNSLTKKLDSCKAKKKKRLKKKHIYWCFSENENDPLFVFIESLLRKWFIDKGYRQTKEFKLYRIYRGGVIRIDRKHAFHHIIKDVNKRLNEVDEGLRDKLMTCALEQCEDILINRVGLLLSLPKINLKELDNEK